jgi:hypothetical protein
MGQPKKQLPPPNPDYVGFSPFTEQFMRDLGYVHESVVEEATSTTTRSRARWDDLQGVMFDNEKWYAIEDIQALLQRKLLDKRGHERHAREEKFVGVL